MRGWKSAEQAANGQVDASTPSTPREANASKLGRRGRFDPAIDWELGKHLYVQGKVVPRGGDLPPEVVFPSLAEIAKAINTTKQNLSMHVYRHNWPKLREEFQGKVEQKVEEAIVDSRARLIAEPLAIVDSYINKFVAALNSNRVRIDAAADLDKMVRLRAFLTERDREKSAQKQVVSLEDMQVTHKAVRARIARVEAEEGLAGVLERGDAQARAADAHEAGKGEAEGEEP